MLLAKPLNSLHPCPRGSLFMGALNEHWSGWERGWLMSPEHFVILSI